jgi:phage tail sheath protein FI
MATLLNLPGVRIQEVRLGAPPIAGVGTSTAAFVGQAPDSARFKNVLRQVTSADQFYADYIRDPTALDDETKGAQSSTKLGDAVLGFFQNGGTECFVVNVGTEVPADIKAGIDLLETREEIDIIAAPGIIDTGTYDALRDQAASTKNRFAILDPPNIVDDIVKLQKGGPLRPKDSIWAAFYYPRIQISPVLKKDKDDLTADPTKKIFAPPSGHIAGLYARTDGDRGVHKAPANAPLFGALAVEHVISDAQQDVLNNDSVNIIRSFSEGPVVFGARTVLVNDAADKTFRYISVRRLATFIEQSLRIGLRFAVFEPNNLALRQTITRSVRGFLDGVWRDGALFGATADEAYYVRFPDPFNTDVERALGKLTLEVGIRVAPPAEFIIIRIGLLDRPANAA